LKKVIDMSAIELEKSELPGKVVVAAPEIVRITAWSQDR